MARKNGDSYVAIDTLFLSLLESSDVNDYLKSLGFDHSQVVTTASDLRKGRKITSATSDALVINANWDSNPIIDVKLETTACGSGYSQLGTQA